MALIEGLWPPQGSRKIHIVHVESPSEIFVRDEIMEDKWSQREEDFKRIMLDHLRTRFKSSLSPGNLTGKPVMVKKETVLYRGRVLEIDTVHSKGAQVFATCRLVDFGTVHHISTTNIEF